MFQEYKIPTSGESSEYQILALERPSMSFIKLQVLNVVQRLKLWQPTNMMQKKIEKKYIDNGFGFYDFLLTKIPATFLFPKMTTIIRFN